jgi:hypothetical protein
MRQLIKCVALAAALSGCASTRSAAKADAQSGGIQGCLDPLIGRGTSVVLTTLGVPNRLIQVGDELFYRYLPEQILRSSPPGPGEPPGCTVDAAADLASPPRIDGTIEITFRDGYATSWRVSSSR